MKRTISIGIQKFAKIRRENYFYIDKTDFIRQWWESGDEVTLITRPRRFGKTLTLDMVDKFFSISFQELAPAFHGLSIWNRADFRQLQGRWPVIFLSFADIKETSFLTARQKICQTICSLYDSFSFLCDSPLLSRTGRQFFRTVSPDMEDYAAALSLKVLSECLARYYEKNVIILLDEYDTPLQEAWVSGYWNELSSFMQGLFNATFKTNPFLERAIMTGITRVSRESIFSDLNNLKIVTTTSEEYADCFGFTREEVLSALAEYELSDRADEVKRWYDGFTFGSRSEIYNPWSITNFLDTGKTTAYWANTSSNRLISRLLQGGSREIKASFETLLRGGSLTTEIDEQIVYSQLDQDERAIWSLMLAAGYLKVRSHRTIADASQEWREEYELALTNFEVTVMFRRMVTGWFGTAASDYNDFIKALLVGDVDAMNTCMNRIALETFSFFDVGKISRSGFITALCWGFWWIFPTAIISPQTGKAALAGMTSASNQRNKKTMRSSLNLRYFIPPEKRISRIRQRPLWHSLKKKIMPPDCGRKGSRKKRFADMESLFRENMY